MLLSFLNLALAVFIVKLERIDSCVFNLQVVIKGYTWNHLAHERIWKIVDIHLNKSKSIT